MQVGTQKLRTKKGGMLNVRCLSFKQIQTLITAARPYHRNVPSPSSSFPSLSSTAWVSTTLDFLFFFRRLRFFLLGDVTSGDISGGGPCKFNKGMLDLDFSGDLVIEVSICSFGEWFVRSPLAPGSRDVSQCSGHTTEMIGKKPYEKQAPHWHRRDV